MNSSFLDSFEKIPQPSREYMTFIDDLRAPNPTPEHEIAFSGCVDAVPETAILSLRKSRQTLPVEFQIAPSFLHEEFEVENSSSASVVRAGDADGFRYGVFFLEDHAGISGKWHRKPFVKHRISRCFFGPTYRAPFFIDELMNDVDYYPDGYLDKLAHENINGLWLTMYFRDLPSDVFPGRGADAEKRFEKLRRTVRKCLRHGIRIYVFFSEPKLFGPSSYSLPLSDADAHPEVISRRQSDGFAHFCTSTPAARSYLHESVKRLFNAVPDLGGIINIMYGEDNGSCVAANTAGDSNSESCPLCSKRDTADLYREYAECMISAMPDSAEFIGWFYAPGQRDGTPASAALRHAVSKWPENASVMFNFESGGRSVQLGKNHIVFDYSLAATAPSELFREISASAARPGAKIQVGCSHEDASVPFLPVPLNLYEKYKFLHEKGISAVMQCWYFGNYPGLMNRAAGILSFEPFPKSGEDFLRELLAPVYGNSPEAIRAMSYFTEGYRLFPSNIAFEWFGPMHQCIGWPLYLFPADKPLPPSWILKEFPEVGGDRIGECLAYHHTLPDALELMRKMRENWEKGFALLAPLRDKAPRDIDLAEAVLLQIRSTCNVLEFYSLREEMLYTGHDRLARMRELVSNEISNTGRMSVLCERDSRLGYHSEAEGYLFFPEKLRARAGLLKDLLENDFPRFRPERDGYRFDSGLTAESGKTHILSSGLRWSWKKNDGALEFSFSGTAGKTFVLEIEPCRMWPPLRMDFDGSGKMTVYDFVFPEIPPIHGNAECVRIPLSVFEGFRRKGFPMRVNVREIGPDRSTVSSWAPGTPWPHRLLQRDWNPEMSGILPVQD